MRATDVLFDVVADYTKTMERTGKNYMHLSAYDRSKFESKTQEQSNLSWIQGWSVIGTTIFAAGFGGGFALGSDKIKPICDIGSKFFTGARDSITPFFQSPLTKMECARQLTEKKYREESQEEITYQQAVDKALNAAAAILQSMAKGGS